MHLLLADDDEPHIPVPIFAFVGLAVFLGVLAFAAVMYLRENGKQSQAQQAPPPVSQTTSSVVASTYQPNYTYQAPVIQQAAPISPSFTPAPVRSSPLSNQPGGAAVSVPREGLIPVGGLDGELKRYSVNNSVYFQSASFSVTKSGSHRQLFGTVAVVNDTPNTVENAKLSLETEEARYSLQILPASAQDSKGGSYPIVGAKDSCIYRVTAENFKDSDKVRVRGKVVMDAESSGRPIHIESPVG